MLGYKNKRDVRIDALKGSACIGVMLAHILALDSVFGMYANGCGKICVWLFMIISGYLFGKSSFHRKQALTVSRVLKFYEKKALRIFPEYLIALALAVALQLINYHSIKEILLMRSTWGHFWYMPVIIQFYMIAPMLTLLRRIVMRREKNIYNKKIECRYNSLENVVYCCLLVIIAIISAVLSPYKNYPENSIEIKWYLPLFLFGIVLAEITRITEGKSIWFDLLSISAFVLILTLTPLGRKIIFGYEPSRYLQNKYLLVGFLWILVLLGVFYGNHVGPLLERFVFMQWISGYSYGIYLFHYCLLMWMHTAFVHMQCWFRGMLTIIFSIVFAIIVDKAKEAVNSRLSDHIRTMVLCSIMTVLCLLN